MLLVSELPHFLAFSLYTLSFLKRRAFLARVILDVVVSSHSMWKQKQVKIAIQRSLAQGEYNPHNLNLPPPIFLKLSGF